MKCEFCSEPATVHFTDMKEGKYRELHLCERCSEKEKNVAPKPKWKESELQIVSDIIAAADEMAGELAKLACPYCGTKYMEFRVKGRLGCPADYDVFQKGLWPLLERIHGSTKHQGKIPRRSDVVREQAESIRLRRELRAAIEREQYEEAARLRDLIRAKEVHDGPE